MTWKSEPLLRAMEDAKRWYGEDVARITTSRVDFNRYMDWLEPECAFHDVDVAKHSWAHVMIANIPLIANPNVRPGLFVLQDKYGFVLMVAEIPHD